MRNKRYIALIMVLLVCCSFISTVPVLGAATQNSELSIQQALEAANRNSPDLKKATLEVEQSGLKKDDVAEKVSWIPAGGLVSSAYQTVMNGYQQAEINYNAKRKAQSAAKDGIAYNVVNAYSTAIQSLNKLELAKAKLDEAKLQLQISSVGKAVGTVADFDYEKAKIGTKQLEEAYNLARSDYDGSIASLRSVLGESESWQPTLTSRASLSKYERNELSTELSRGLNESVSVWQSQALLDIEKSQQSWIISGVSSKMQNLNLQIAQIDYNKTKSDTQASIESLYYALDSLQGQVAVADQAYANAKKDLAISELKYQLGLISKSSLVTAQVSELSSRVSLENARATLAQRKAQYAVLTGQVPYDPKDWSSPVAAATATPAK